MQHKRNIKNGTSCALAWWQGEAMCDCLSDRIIFLDRFLLLDVGHDTQAALYLSQVMRKCVLCHMRTTKVPISLRSHAI